MSKCILIIDDDQDFSELLRGIYQQADYTVHTALSAEKGFEVLQEEPIELIVSDHRLPGGITGTEFLAQLRERGIDLPVIVVSGFLNDEAIRELIRDGVAGIFIKPLNIFSLLKKTADILEEHEKQLVKMGREASPDGPAIMKSIGRIEGLSSKGKTFLQQARKAATFRRNLLLIGPNGTQFEDIARDIVSLAENSQRCVVMSPGSVSDQRIKDLFEGEEGETPITLILTDTEKYTAEEVDMLVELGDEKGGGDGILRMIFCLSQSVEDLYDNELIDEDLYLFLGTNELNVPELKNMPEDLLAIARAEIEKSVEDAKFDMKLRTLLLSHDWPENMVELRAVVLRAATLAQPMAPQVRHFEAALKGGSEDQAMDDARSTFERFLIQEKRRYEAAQNLLFES
ncbi:MAG: sigma-54-dependent transcriptional regulator [Puniceicoccaceae bacterium]